MKLQRKITFSIMGGICLGFAAFMGINHSMMKETSSIEIHEKLEEINEIVSSYSRSVEEVASATEHLSSKFKV